MKNIIFKNKYSEKEKGFTLVETLVAVAIFASSITALMSITARGINDNVFVKNKLTASYLAAEGVELVRNIRDNAALSLSPNYWNDVFLASGSSNSVFNCYTSNTPGAIPNYCYIDGSVTFSSVPQALPCEDGICPQLSYDSIDGIYGYSGGQESNFNRVISVKAVNDDGKEVLVTSSVSWRQGNRTFTTSHQYSLFDWIGN